MLRFIRDRFTDLEKKLSLEISFYKERADRKFLYDDRTQRTATGLSPKEFDYLASYIKPFESRFRTFDYRESLNLLLTVIRFLDILVFLNNVFLRQGINFEFMNAVSYHVTMKKMTPEYFNLTIKRVLFILVGKSNQGYEETWYNQIVKSFGKHVDSAEIGKFYRDHVFVNNDLQKTIRFDGASTLAKAIEMRRDELEAFIKSCEDRTPEEVQELVESRLSVRDLAIVVDATYVRRVLLINFSIF